MLREEVYKEQAEAVQAEEAGTEGLATPPDQTSQQLPAMDDDAFPPTVEAFIQEYEVCAHSLWSPLLQEPTRVL